MGQFETYGYDLGGRLISRRDFNGKETSYSYDNLDRLLSKQADASFSQAAIRYSYNEVGQRESMIDTTGTTTYSHDNRSRLTSKASPQGSLSYGYNEVGNLTRVSTASTEGVSIEYSYDELNRLQTVTDRRIGGINNQTRYSYDKVGNLQRVRLPNEVETEYQYNRLNRLTNVNTAKSGTSISSYSYTLGSAGNRLSVTEKTGRIVSYSYDAIYRLISETISSASNPAHNGSITYSYDEVGNRLSRISTVSAITTEQNISVDDNDRLTRDSYDNNGSTVEAKEVNYTYDFEKKYLVDTNNLTGLTTLTATSGMTAILSSVSIFPLPFFSGGFASINS